MASVSSPNPSTTSTSTRYSLQVEYIGDSSRQRNATDQKSHLYVDVTLGDVTDRFHSIEEDSSQPWKHTFTLLSSDQTSEITVRVIQLSTALRENTPVDCLNFKLNQLVETCKTGNAELTLSSRLGLLRICLTVVNEISYAVINIRNAGAENTGYGSGRFSRLMGLTGRAGGFVASQLSANNDLYKDIGDLLQKLDIFARISGDIASIELHLKAAWSVISALYKGVSIQVEWDRSVIDLVGVLLEKFQFVDDNESLRVKTLFLRTAIESLLKITDECCTFINTYFACPLIRRRGREDAMNIDYFENHINGLSELFDYGTSRYEEAIKKQTDLRNRLRPSDNTDMEESGRPRCLENTQLEPRCQINDWIDSKSEKRVFWLYGVAGSGKSTIAATIAEELRETRQLGAFFDRATSNPKDTIRTMAYQLAMSNPIIATHITDSAFGDNPWANTFLDKFSSPEDEETIVIIFDALDQCGDPTARKELLQSFGAFFFHLPTNFRLLITSRSEPDLQELICSHTSVQSFKLDPEANKRDVSSKEISTEPETQPEPEGWQMDVDEYVSDNSLPPAMPLLDVLQNSSENFRTDKATINPLRKTLAKLRHLDLTGQIIYSNSIAMAHGGYAEVFVGECPSRDNSKVAVKRLRIYAQGDQDFSKQLAKEMNVWSKLAHPNILPLWGYVLEGDYPCLISQWIDNGTARHYLETHPECNIENMVIGVTRGLGYLHAQDIIHSDIKADNVLVSRDGEPLVCDFGISRCLNSTNTILGITTSGVIKGSIRWMSPEILNLKSSESTPSHTKESDVWAFGMLVYELLTRKLPFYRLQMDVHVLFAIIDGQIPSFERSHSLSPRLRSFGSICCDEQKCWNKDPRQRPTIQTILSDLERC